MAHKAFCDVCKKEVTGIPHIEMVGPFPEMKLENQFAQ